MGIFARERERKEGAKEAGVYLLFLEAAQSPSNALKEAKNKLLICRKGHKKRHDKAQHPFIPCEKLFRSSIIILREHHLTTEY